MYQSLNHHAADPLTRHWVSGIAAEILLRRFAAAVLAELSRRMARAQLRRAARQMQALPDATLRDIGVSRWEIDMAIRYGRPVVRRDG